VSSRLPKWVRIEHLPLRAVAGAKLFAKSGCTTCHTYLGSGSSNLGVPPDLTAEGAKRRGIQFQIRQSEVPNVRSPGLTDAAVRGLGREHP
jgi:mono/diheme cytochrome c family protein